ncbi:MAG: YjgN family protein [Gammaproteobacteria bacterium]
MEERAGVAAGTTTERFGYSGNASEYFRIWIVSLCLTVITLGVYSAWAKVRKRRYLYRSTRLAGAGFDYHANPVVILRGRLIAVGMLAVYAAAGYFAPGAETLLGLAFLAALPWLIVRARMFNARNTSYRNLRFRFDPVYGEAYKVIVGWNMLATLTLGLLYPYAHFRRSALIVSNTHYGNLDLRLGQIARGFYATYLRTSALVLIALIGAGVGSLLVPARPDGAAEPAWSVLAFAPPAFAVVLIGIAAAWLGPAILRLTLGHTVVGEHTVNCDWSIPRIVFINVTNFIAVALTLGLAIPWATIRLQRYQFEHLSIDIRGDIESVVATQADEVSALGEEIGELFDVDIGL